MSQTIATKDAVAQVRDQLRAAGKKVTVGALRAGLGHQGSWSTIGKLKKELDDADRAAKDSPEGLQAFRDLWSRAEQAGRSQRDEELQDLRETMAALEAESQRFEGEALAAQVQAQDLARKLDEAAGRYNDLTNELRLAREDAVRNSSRLVATMEEHRACEANSQEQMAALQQKNHELELELARAATKLEMSTRPPGPASKPATRVSRRSRLNAPNGNGHQSPTRA